MPIEVKHRAAPALQMEMAEYAGQGQYRKWLSEYKAQQEQAKTQAFLGAFSMGSQIGLAGRAQKHQAAMQTARFGHESSMLGSRQKWAAGQAALDRENRLKLGNLNKTQAAAQGAASAQQYMALLNPPGGASGFNAAITQKNVGRFGGVPPAFWDQGRIAQNARMQHQYRQALTDPQYYGTPIYKDAVRLFHGANQGSTAGAMLGVAGGGGSGPRNKGTRAGVRAQVAQRLYGPFNQQTQAGVARIQGNVPAGMVISPRVMSADGLHELRPAVMGTAPGAGESYEDQGRSWFDGPTALGEIRDYRASQKQKYNAAVEEETNRIMEARWTRQDDPSRQLPPGKGRFVRTNQETGEREEEVFDIHVPGDYGLKFFRENIQPNLDLEDAANNKLRDADVAEYERFKESVPTIREGETKTEYLKRIRDLELDTWDGLQMPEDGWGAYPGRPAKGMTPTPHGDPGFDPYEVQPHYEVLPGGGLQRTYRQMWRISPTGYGGVSDHNVRTKNSRAHRVMQQRAIEHGVHDGVASSSWRAYEDVYGHSPTKGIENDYLNWQAARQLEKANAFFEKHGIEGDWNNIVRIGENDLNEEQKKTFARMYQLHQAGKLSRSHWAGYTDEEKRQFRGMAHLFDYKAGYGVAQSKGRQVPFAGNVDLPPPGMPHAPGSMGPEGGFQEPQQVGGTSLPGGVAGALEFPPRPSVGSGWAIRVGNELQFIPNPDPEALKLTPPEEKLPEKDKIELPGAEPPPPPSKGTLLPGYGGETQGQATKRYMENRTVRNMKGLGAIQEWVNLSGSEDDRGHMTVINTLIKKHKTVPAILRSKDRGTYRHSVELLLRSYSERNK